MDESADIRHKIDFLLSSDAQPTQTKIATKYKKTKCSECNKLRRPSKKNPQICCTCYKAKKRIIPSGNKVIDDFIRYTQINDTRKNGKMMFVPYEKFENIELIGEGGFSKIYKATWIDCKISKWGTLNYTLRSKPKTVALKKLTYSKNFTSKELNELKMFYNYSLSVRTYDIYGSSTSHVNEYYGITQDPVTQDLIFIMPYYDSDLTNYVTKDFFDIRWYHKLDRLKEIINGLAKIHNVNILHRDLHSGNILLSNLYDYAPSMKAKICDLGTSKSATENDDNNDNEEDNIYGIISYVAPEVLQGKKYTKASDIYSFGMIMWELMVGRRPFWDRNHNTELIIEICDDQLDFYQRNSNDKRKFEDGDSFNNGTSNKKIKPIEDENNDYATKELDLDIDMNPKQFNDELNELKMFYHYSLSEKVLRNIYDDGYSLVSIYYGITQDPNTQDLIFIMPYYDSDLTHYLTKRFFKVAWYEKLRRLKEIINGLAKLHNVNIIHRDLHSGNILLNSYYAKTSDLGTSKSATENDDNNDNEEDNIYGIIPYVAPEILQGKKYTKASDIYSFGMIMWELIVGRRPFWDRNHNTELIIEISSTRSLRSQSSITLKLGKNSNDKRKFEDNHFINGTGNKKIKPIEDENNDYDIKELELDININSKQFSDDEYITSEINFDI
ncbi:kinase-like protein [Rhizophagus irregularis]|nr:kinase-like protein [Rhizophagus irregularis]